MPLPPTVSTQEKKKATPPKKKVFRGKDGGRKEEEKERYKENEGMGNKIKGGTGKRTFGPIKYIASEERAEKVQDRNTNEEE